MNTPNARPLRMHKGNGGLLVVAAAGLALAACTTLPESAAPAAPSATTATPAATPAGAPGASPRGAARPPAPGSATTPAAAAAPVVPGQPRPFAEVIKEAKETVGFFRSWQKDEKVWLEIGADQFDVPFHFLMNHPQGVGERGVYGGMMGFSHVVRFRKIGNNVQLIASNSRFTAKAGSPIAEAVKEGFSDSLLGNSAVASQPHPERKSVLIELNALLLADLPAGSRFARGVHQRGYTFDARNSSIERIHATDDSLSVLVLAHYANPKASLPPAPPHTPAPPNPYPPFQNLPDARSLFLGLQYSFSKLPDPMRPRPADPRVGHFVDEVWDFSSDRAQTARKHWVQRWRLEKKDPAAELSEPVKPVVFWIDRNVPDQYRDAVREGILEWNKAFERIGFKDAIKVEIQPENSDWTTADARHASVRWFAGTDPGFAIGPSETDPRTGEILDADIAIPENWSRGERRFVREDLNTASVWPAFDAYKTTLGFDPRACTYAVDALAEMQFGLDLLVERGEITPDSPEADAFVRASLKEVTMHEIGHTLGLRHNFRSSIVYPLEKLSDPEFTRKNGLAGSVMDYQPINLALQGEQQGEFHQSTLGPYDYWAIEYAYKPLDATSELAELGRIAGRGTTDPLLAFSSDEESGAGLDPAASQFDLGSDPLAYLERRLRLSRELWTRLENKQLDAGQPYDVLRRSFDSGLRQTARAAQLVTRYVSGVNYVRDFAGTGRYPLTPVAPDKQRSALKLLADAVFSVDSFRFSPQFMQRMGIDYLMIEGPNTDPNFSLSARVLSLQAGALGQLMSDPVALRLLDSESKVAAKDDSFRLSELYATLHATIWSELKSGQDIPLIRRNLQRDHVNRVAGALLRPSATVPADARALLRVEAAALRTEIAAAQKRPAFSNEARAHLAQAAITLDEALKAPVVRQTL